MNNGDTVRNAKPRSMIEGVETKFSSNSHQVLTFVCLCTVRVIGSDSERTVNASIGDGAQILLSLSVAVMTVDWFGEAKRHEYYVVMAGTCPDCCTWRLPNSSVK